ncbi:hypothetical protein C5C24_05790 [Rathayibacter sp. AY2B3]|uniref:restriction endonuclease subunit S n=1 Tax=Rathayibacter sp. AY2B3 TaxID=2080569 RepID=UPI000CE93313|nr:restriction endonuclease subunit S [Rathayibacter sp. AY2B3]PPG51989.1 hypothetical protein C5C24_05790 [Rathayibacter sp. AY2B3]
MSAWREVKVQDLGDIFDGPHATPKRTNKGPHFLNISSLIDGRLALEHSDRVSEEDFVTWTRRVTPIEGDLLFSYETRLGDAALMPAEIRACLGRRMAILRPKRSVVDPRFLLYAYRGPAMREQIEAKAIRGATVDRIPLNRFGDWSIQIPELSEQRSIAKVLGALDDKIAANQRTAHASWALSAALYSQVSRNAGGSVLLGDLVATQYGLTTPATGGPAQLLRVTDINKRPWITWESVPFCDPSPADMIRYKLAPGNIVVARMADPGKSAWISSDPLEAVFASYLVRLKVHDPTQSAFVYHFLQSQAYLDYVQFSKQGSVQSNMNAKVIVNCPMPDPGKVDLKTFNEKASLLRQTIDISLAEASRLEALRDTLLPALMSGKLHVKDAERAVEDVL